MSYWHGEDLDILMLLRLWAHRRACKLLSDYNQRIPTFHSIYDYFAVLKALDTNAFNLHQYFKEKSSSHPPSHMHNTRHRTNSNEVFEKHIFSQ